MNTPCVSLEMAEDFRRDGYLLLSNAFNKEEVAALLQEVEQGDRVATSSYDTQDAEGRKAQIAIWHELGSDIWSRVSTDPRIVNNVRLLMGEDVAFFHGKVILKLARGGGSWEWHQDYGYWYNQGFLYPRMISAFVSLDPSVKENGCLQVLKGSHHLGRLEHGTVGTQTGADAGRIGIIEGMLERVPVEMEPGSVLFFDSNLLHTSGPNDSDMHRRSFIICYNAMANPQIGENGQMVERKSCPVSEFSDILETV
ncbi:MAG: phytanoyl-CoA dioxygenase family protein [Opitutaceae bacterium]|nr:phytanoyl-CoA dioxygenase family protein [Opitutaceae bacterium]